MFGQAGRLGFPIAQSHSQLEISNEKGGSKAGGMNLSDIFLQLDGELEMPACLCVIFNQQGGGGGSRSNIYFEQILVPTSCLIVVLYVRMYITL